MRPHGGRLRTELCLCLMRAVTLCAIVLISQASQAAPSTEPATAAATSPTRPLQRVRLRLKWYHQFQFAGYYAAIEKGFYRDAGLDVVLQEARPGAGPIDAVVSGSAEYGVGTTDILLRWAQGKPIVALGVIFQHSPTVVMVREDSGIRTPQDLRGKRLMMTEATDPESLAMLRNEGIDLQQVYLQPHTWDLQDLIAGRTDAVTVYKTDEPFLMQQQNVPVTLIDPMNYGIDFYGDCLFTSQAEASDHPERAMAFLTASRRGWLYAMMHRAEIADLILSRYSTRKSRDALLFEAAAMEPLIVPKLVEIGHMNPGRWQRIADQYARLGLMPAGHSLDGFIFSPPRPWTSRYRRPLIYAAAAVLLCGAIVLLVLLTFNRRLKAAVARQTTLLRENEQRLRTAAEQAAAANQAKDRFLATLSHELRTPLTPVLAMLSSLQHDHQLPVPLQQDVEMMRRSVDLEARLIDDLLDLTRITHGRLTLEMQTVDVHQMLQRALRISEAEAIAKHQIITLIPAASAYHVRGDPARIQQVFWNVIKNAIRYTGEGGTITIESHNQPDADGSGQQLAVSVHDTGIGIAPDVLPIVFEAFEKGVPSSSRRRGGLGLGMTIARSVIQGHGGQITAASEGIGRGATFTIVLPVIPAQEQTPNSGPTSGVSAITPLRILLVEDHATTQMILARLLRKMGHEVVTADSVDSGIKAGLAGRFDLLLSDLGLPDGSGLEIIRRLGDQPQLRAIALSGYGMEADLQKSRDAGFALHLVKPVDIDKLRSAIAAVCAQASDIPAAAITGDGSPMAR